MPTIPVETYSLGIARNSTQPYAHVSIAGPVLAHGIRNRATLYFFPSYSQLGGYALNVGGLNFDGIHVVGLLPHEDFDRMYDVLRNEAPVHVYYTHGSSPSTTKPLTNIAIQTGTEPPGEGPTDADSVEAMLSLVVTDLPVKAPLTG